MLQLPVITSESAGGLLALIDQSGLMVSGDPVAEISHGRNTTLKITDDATGALTTPAALVSMFQTEAAAIKGVLSASDPWVSGWCAALAKAHGL